MAGLTKEQEKRQRRDAFALSLLLLMRELHDAGFDTNHALAAELNRRGVPSEHGRPWIWHAVAMIRYRLLAMGASPPPACIPPPRRRRGKG